MTAPARLTCTLRRSEVTDDGQTIAFVPAGTPVTVLRFSECREFIVVSAVRGLVDDAEDADEGDGDGPSITEDIILYVSPDDLVFQP